jgi:purine-binding chemotaxis protein CheW
MWQHKETFLLTDRPQAGAETQKPQDNSYINDVEEHDTSHSGVQHIGFKLHTEEFLLPMVMVREIIMLPTITYVPSAAFLVEGIVALRGEIMPVLNLRRFLKFVRGKAESTTRVIILHCEYGGFGVVVDEITEFVWLQNNEIETTIPQNFFPPEYQVLAGVARVGDKVRGIIEVNKLVVGLLSQIKQKEGDDETGEEEDVEG